MLKIIILQSPEIFVLLRCKRADWKYFNRFQKHNSLK